MSHWQPDDTVIVRNIARSDGTVTTALPTIVIRDDETLLALYIPIGTVYKNNWIIPPEQRVESVQNIVPSSRRQYKNVTAQNDSLRLYLPGKGFSVGLSFGSDGAFKSWYGNLEAPYIRTPLGIDTRDFALDVIAYPDGRWYWKDEAEFQRRLEIGIDSAEHQARVRAAGQEFVNRFERNEWPFNAGWQTWRPTLALTPRILPDNWMADMGTHTLLSNAVW